MLNPNEIVKGKVEYAVVTTNKSNQKQLEIKVLATEKLIGTRVEDGSEPMQPEEFWTYLHLDEAGTSADDRRGISRQQLAQLTGVEIEDSWVTDAGYQRLVEDHPNSLIPEIVGKDIMLTAKASKNDPVKSHINIYFPRVKPKGLSLAEVRKTLNVF